MWKLQNSLLILFSCLILLHLKTHFQARLQFQRAELHLKQGHLAQAIRLYGETICSYTPGNRYVKAALQRLQQIAKASYRQTNWRMSLTAKQQSYSALNMLRHFSQPHAKKHKRLQSEVSILLSYLPSISAGAPLSEKKIQKQLHQKLALKHRSTTGIFLFTALFFFILILLSFRSLSNLDILVKVICVKCHKNLTCPIKEKEAECHKDTTI